MDEPVRPPPLVWPRTDIPTSTANRIYDLVWNDGDYSAKCAADLGPAYREIDLPLDQVWSMRNVYVKQKIVHRHRAIMSSRKRILEEYRAISADVPVVAGIPADICELSKKWNYPPLYLLRAIFTWLDMHLTAKQMALLFANPRNANAAIIPAGRERDQYELARACDASPDSENVAADAQDREDAFVARFSAYPHRTQFDLALEQTRAYGRPITTPDILFVPPIRINDTLVNWIDYKAYIGVPGTFIASKIREQAKRYRTAYGPGAIVFRDGFVHGMKKAVGATCLDERVCPLPPSQ